MSLVDTPLITVASIWTKKRYMNILNSKEQTEDYDITNSWCMYHNHACNVYLGVDKSGLFKELISFLFAIFLRSSEGHSHDGSYIFILINGFWAILKTILI